ncbi:MAG: helix-turn-helix transcriptional regulator [Alphaproteobacteria bacterium]
MAGSNFPHNLRFLCSYKESISLVCRDLGINRSQFNRYLSGASSPRDSLMRKICDYFGVEHYEILLPAAEFESLIAIRGVSGNFRDRRLTECISHIIRSSDKRILEVQGTFFEYYYSFAKPGSVLRLLVRFEEHDGIVEFNRMVRIGAPGQSCQTLHRYSGIAVMFGDRIFMHDHQRDRTLDLTQTILYPDFSGQINVMTGMSLGVAANQQRTPCCARTYLERVSPLSTWRQNYRQCGLLDAKKGEVPQIILDAIDNSHSGPNHFTPYSMS